MKWLRVFLTVFLLFVLLLFVGLLLFIRNFDINKFLPQITQEISKSFHMPVEINYARLGWGMTKGLTLILENINVSKTLMTVERVEAQVDIFALLKKEVRIIEVNIISPRISVVQSTKETTSDKTDLTSNSSNEKIVVPIAPTQNSEQVSFPNIFVKQITVVNGTFFFEDKNSKAPFVLKVTNIKVDIHNLSLIDFFDFNITLNILSKNNSNLFIAGQCKLDLNKESAQIADLQIKTGLDQLDLNKLKEMSPVIQNLAVWPKELKGNVLVHIPSLKVSSGGLQGNTLSISINTGYIKFKELLSPISDINLQIDSNFKDLSLKQCQGRIGKGEINVNGEVKDLMSMPKYNFRIQTKSLKVQELLNENAWPFILNGMIESDILGAGESLELSAMIQNLKFNGDVKLIEAQLEKFNILKVILSKLYFIPGISNLIENSLPARINVQLSNGTTVLDKVETKVSFQDKVLNISEANVQSKFFTILSDGTVDTGANVNLNVKTYLSTELSEDLVKSIKELKGLLNDQNRIYIPGKVSGQIPSIGYLPETDYITKNTAVSEGASQLEKILDKNPKVKNILNAVLGGGNDQSVTDSTVNSSDSQNQSQDEPAKKLINKVLKDILR